MRQAGIALVAALTSFGVRADVTVALELLADGLAQPLAVRNAGDGSGRLFIVEKGGRIRLVENGSLAAENFLDISGLVSTNSERGLLGLAFHPDHAANGLFFVHYTNASGDTVIARYRVFDGNRNRADVSTATVLLTIDQPAANHNGGDLHFGPDGYLYTGLGDGGGAGDPDDTAQNPASLLGKMLRIDVDNPEANVGAGACGGGAHYGIPGDNPFLGNDTEGVCDETWALGLRNPFRFSFDRQRGDLWIGDVGQNRVEEVNREPGIRADTSVAFRDGFERRGGLNFGWDCREGSTPYDDPPGDPGTPSPACATASGLTDPVLEYSSAADGQGRCSVTGGYVYRGTIPGLQGSFLFGDFCTGELFRGIGAGTHWEWSVLLDTGLNISSFGEDEAGALYVVHYGGAVYRLVESP